MGVSIGIIYEDGRRRFIDTTPMSFSDHKICSDYVLSSTEEEDILKDGLYLDTYYFNTKEGKREHIGDICILDKSEAKQVVAVCISTMPPEPVLVIGDPFKRAGGDDGEESQESSEEELEDMVSPMPYGADSDDDDREVEEEGEGDEEDKQD